MAKKIGGSSLMNQIFSQVGREALTIERLSDGSTAIVDNRAKSVHSLNPSATLVWDACAQGATVARIQAAIEAKSGFPVETESIHQALAQLQRANLIESDAPMAMEAVDLGRRTMLKRAGTVGAIAIPVVLTLTATEQRAYAVQIISGTTTTRIIV